MLEIKKILNENNIQYEDEKLSWENAKLSAYQQKLEKYKNDENVIIYGIELEDDIKPVGVGALFGIIGVILAHPVSPLAFWIAAAVLMFNFLFGYFAYKYKLKTNQVDKK